MFLGLDRLSDFCSFATTADDERWPAKKDGAGSGTIMGWPSSPIGTDEKRPYHLSGDGLFVALLLSKTRRRLPDVNKSLFPLFVFPNQLCLGENVSLHGLQQFLFRGADPRLCLSTACCCFLSVQVEHRIQSVEPEVVVKC